MDHNLKTEAHAYLIGEMIAACAVHFQSLDKLRGCGPSEFSLRRGCCVACACAPTTGADDGFGD